MTETVQPWSFWIVDGVLIGPVGVCIGFMPDGRPNFVGIRVGHNGTPFLETEQVSQGNRPGTLRLMECMGSMPNSIPKHLYVTVCNSCGKDAKYLKGLEKWACKGNCATPEPKTFENYALREWLLDMTDLVRDYTD